MEDKSVQLVSRGSFLSKYLLQNPYFKKCPPLIGLRLSTGLCKKDFGCGGKKCILEIFSNKIENIREIFPNKGTTITVPVP